MNVTLLLLILAALAVGAGLFLLVKAARIMLAGGPPTKVFSHSFIGIVLAVFGAVDLIRLYAAYMGARP